MEMLMQHYSSSVPLERLAMVSDRMKARYKPQVANTVGFREGQLVLVYNPQQ